jgi:hypothetical protein
VIAPALGSAAGAPLALPGGGGAEVGVGAPPVAAAAGEAQIESTASNAKTPILPVEMRRPFPLRTA